MLRRHQGSLILLGLVVAALAGCVQAQPEINRVEAYALPKSLFAGEWFYNLTVVDVPATRTVTFEGESTFMNTHRVRWDIQEGFLYARASYERVQGGKPGVSQDTAEYMGEVVGAWKITDHFDVRKGYNPVTGEPLNTLEENAADCKWYDCKYMRVDWSLNLANDPTFLYDWDKYAPLKKDPIPYYEWNSNDPKFKPVFDPDTGYIDFVSALAVAPQDVSWSGFSYPSCWLYGGQDAVCSTEIVKVRNSFLRRDANRDYEPKLHKGDKDEWFGYFVNERWNWKKELGITYPAKDQFLNRHNLWVSNHLNQTSCAALGGDCTPIACNTDEDCKAFDATSRCDLYVAFHKKDVDTDTDGDGLPDAFEVTISGLDPQRGDSNGNGTPDGSDDANGNGLPDREDYWKWDQSNLEHHCTLPLEKREPKPIVYYDTGKFPRSLVCDELENDPNQDGSAKPCDPWVFTPDAKVRDEKWSPLHYASNTYDDTYWRIYLRGAFNWGPADYEKWIQQKDQDPATVFPDDAEKQSVLAQFGDAAHGYYAFIICPNNPPQESDPWVCRFPNHSFSQAMELMGRGIKFNGIPYDRAKKLLDAGKPLPEKPFLVRPGDIRYSYVHYAKDYSAVSPLGYGPSASDPRTGEILSGTANIYAAMDYYATYIQDVTNLVSGNMSPSQYIDGVSLDKWLQRIKEASTARQDQQRFISHGDLNNMYQAMEQPWMQNIKRLGSAEAFATMTDGTGNALSQSQLKVKLLGMMGQSGLLDPAKAAPGIKAVRGTPLEKSLLDNEVLMAAGFLPGTVKDLNADVLDQASPARDGLLKKLRARDQWRFEVSNKRAIDFAEDMMDEGLAGLAYRLERVLGKQGMDSVKGWAAIRRLMMRPVVEHEMGHTVGLMHNFGGSDDAMNFSRDYWRLRTNDFADHNICNYKNLAAGQVCPFFVRPMTDFQLGKTDKNISENLWSLHEYGYTSIMDYDKWPTMMGHGLGSYDLAALMFGYAEKVEVFKDPGTVKAGKIPGDPNVFDEYFTGNGQVLMLYGNRAQSYHYTNLYAQMGDLLFDPNNRALVPDREVKRASGETGSGWYYTAGNTLMPRVPYIYCSHNRANISESCMTWDWGADEYERMKMHLDEWEYWYPITGFTRYRYGASPGGYLSRRYDRFYHRLKNFNNSYALYQSLFHQWYTSDQIKDFFADPVNGWGSFTVAVNDGFNALLRTLAMPDIKSFKGKAAEPDGQLIYSEAAFANEGLFSTDVSTGRYFTTSWADTNYEQKCGYEWQECLHHMGFFLDKIAALDVLQDAMTYFVARDTAEDVRQWRISFFNNFTSQIVDFFGGVLAADHDLVAPWFNEAQPRDKTEVEKITVKDAAGQDKTITTKWVSGVGFRDYATYKPGDGEKPWPPKPAKGGAIEAATRFSLQVHAGIRGLFGFQGNFDNEFVERSRLWKKGKGTTWETRATDRVSGVTGFLDPFTGTTYVGLAFRDNRGIAQKMIAHANKLKARSAYCTQATPPQPDQCEPTSATDRERAENDLYAYRQLMDIMVQATTIYDEYVNSWSWDPFDP